MDFDGVYYFNIQSLTFDINSNVKIGFWYLETDIRPRPECWKTKNK